MRDDYLSGRLGIADVERFEDHLFICSACREEVVAEEVLRSAVKERGPVQEAAARSAAGSLLSTWQRLSRRLGRWRIPFLDEGPLPAEAVLQRNGAWISDRRFTQPILEVNLTPLPRLRRSSAQATGPAWDEFRKIAYLELAGFLPELEGSNAFLLVVPGTVMEELFGKERLRSPRGLLELEETLQRLLQNTGEPDERLRTLSESANSIPGSFARRADESVLRFPIDADLAHLFRKRGNSYILVAGGDGSLP